MVALERSQGEPVLTSSMTAQDALCAVYAGIVAEQDVSVLMTPAGDVATVPALAGEC